MNVMYRRCGVVLALAGLLFAGCGPSELPKKSTYPVHGKITLHGEPARYVLVRLAPAEGSTGVTAEGKTDGEGKFTVRTYANDEDDGAVPGEYSVQLSSWSPTVGGALPPGANPTKITSGINAGLDEGTPMDMGVSVEVKDEDNDLNIDIP